MDAVVVLTAGVYHTSGNHAYGGAPFGGPISYSVTPLRVSQGDMACQKSLNWYGSVNSVTVAYGILASHWSVP